VGEVICNRHTKSRPKFGKHKYILHRNKKMRDNPLENVQKDIDGNFIK
jgi:hypothetical protein